MFVSHDGAGFELENRVVAIVHNPPDPRLDGGGLSTSRDPGARLSI